ncbi:MAG: hypothetical protein M3Z05_13055 [Gemmatimonadota bacterium]|nr:hypothetical protein [Gemmatimonadota bacterium]
MKNTGGISAFEGMAMGRIRYVTVCTIIALSVIAGCRSRPQSWPIDPPDLTGQVLEVRAGGGVLGKPTTGVGSYGSSENRSDARRLRIRVISARSTEHEPEAFVTVDGVTQVARSSESPDGDAHPDLEGAFVRVWLRSKLFAHSPTDVSGTARMIAIDSVAVVPAQQE